MDQRLFLLIHGLAGHWFFADVIGIFFAKYAIYLFAPIAAFCFWYKQKTLTPLILAIACASAINTALGMLFFRARPFVTLHLAPLIDVAANSKAFPSDHTAVSIAIAYAASRAYPSWWPVWYGAALAIGIARIYVGVHYPADIFAGVVVGFVAGYLAYDYLPRLLAHMRTRYGKK